MAYSGKNRFWWQSSLSFIIHISADNRYKLYVNDSLPLLGPARAIHYWNYEKVRHFAFLLKSVKNIVAALVLMRRNSGWRAQETYAIVVSIVQGNTATEQALLNTDNTWKCRPRWSMPANTCGFLPLLRVKASVGYHEPCNQWLDEFRFSF